VQEKEALLEQERSKSEELNTRAQQLQTECHVSAERIEKLQSTEKELVEKSRDQVYLYQDTSIFHTILKNCAQERELQLLDANVADLRAEAEHHQRKVRELEEQIQSDDRAERLENSLRNTQDRADELEFQLSKLKQVSPHTETLEIKRLTYF